MTIRGIITGLWKIVKWGFITLGMIVMLILAINAADENSSPELKALMVLPQDDAGQSNGYVALAGLNAPPDKGVATYGAQWIDTYNAAGEKSAIEKARDRFPATNELKFQGNLKHLCNPAKLRCLPLAGERASFWRKLATENEMAMERQRSLMAYNRFEESYFPPSLESPVIAYGSSSRLLLLDLIALDAAEGHLEQALTALEARIAFDRRALLGSRILITGMVARSWVGQDYALLADIVAARPKGLARQQDRLQRMTEPLDISQLRTIAGRMIEGEHRYLSRSIPALLDAEETGTLSASMMRPFFRLGASQNMVAHSHAALQAWIANFSPEDADAWIAKGRQMGQSENDDAVGSWRVLYNPVGKLGFAIGRTEYDGYILRLSDLIGITRLARLQVEAATAENPAGDMSAFLASNRALYDPYTGKPMGWDSGKRQFYFDGRGEYPKDTPKRFQAGI